MQKIITQKEIEAVMAVLFNYNVGAKDYSAVQQMFEKLPVLEGDKNAKSEKTPEKASKI